jgi:RNA polymerase sigma-70 factor (ECF subfamily)
MKSQSTAAPNSDPARAGAWSGATDGGAPAAAPAYDATDFRAVYAAWFADVLRWIRALGAPAADLDDLVQDVFVVVYRRLADFDGRNMAGWLYQIAVHQVRDHRRLRWIKNVFRWGIPLSDRMVATGPTPVMALETREKRQLLARLLSQLSEPLRATFVLFELDGYTGEEIAEIHQVPINTVRARIHRARKKLLALLPATQKGSRERTG